VAARELLSQLAPGQDAQISQGAGNWRNVRCEEIRRDCVFLVVIPGQGQGVVSLGNRTLLQTQTTRGVLRCVGTLRGGATVDERFGTEFVPSKTPPQLINRRAAFRVSLSLRVRLFGTPDPSAETLDTEWTCALRDLSVGGAKVVLASPPPAERSRIELHLPLETESEPLIMTGVVLEASPGRNPPPMDAVVRLMLEEVTRREENILGSYVNRVQLNHSRKGVR
jgi:hypothetical protein